MTCCTTKSYVDSAVLEIITAFHFGLYNLKGLPSSLMQKTESRASVRNRLGPPIM